MDSACCLSYSAHSGDDKNKACKDLYSWFFKDSHYILTQDLISQRETYTSFFDCFRDREPVLAVILSRRATLRLSLLCSASIHRGANQVEPFQCPEKSIILTSCSLVFRISLGSLWSLHATRSVYQAGARVKMVIQTQWMFTCHLTRWRLDRQTEEVTNKTTLAHLVVKCNKNSSKGNPSGWRKSLYPLSNFATIDAYYLEKLWDLPNTCLAYLAFF